MRLTWVWLLVAVGAAAAWIGFAIQVVGGKPVGTDPAPDVVLIVLWLLVGLGLPLLAFAARLIVEVRADQIEIRFIPFPRRTIPIDQIRSCASVRYRPIRQYGGWGIRWWPWRPSAYTVSGNRGVQLELGHGKQLLIGSRRPDELAAAISAARSAVQPAAP